MESSGASITNFAFYSILLLTILKWEL